jgi:Spy/CpxP family protein refolding chaperone
MSISIHDGKVQIEGIADLVQAQLERVIQVLDNLPDVPPDVRERVKGRVRAVRGKLTSRLGRLRSLDLDKIGPEMERMGDEIEREMEGLDKDLAQLGDKFGKDLGKELGKDIGKDLSEKIGKDLARSLSRSHSGRDSDDGDDDDSEDTDDEDKVAVALPPPDVADPSDPLGELKKQLTLGRAQKDQLAKLRAESEHKIDAAKRELEVMSNRLHDTLGNSSVNEADVERQIDQISAKEATIRKARVLAWVRARSLLSEDQRKQVEAAVKKSR